MGKTTTEWTDESWNVVTGCTKVSLGCKHCYAERMARRLAGRCGYPEAPNHFDVTLHPDRLEQPLRWRKPRRVFVASMGDPFHEDVPPWFVCEVWQIMRECPQHTFLILTKRPKRMKRLIRTYIADNELGVEPLSNVWLGVSVENQVAADERIPILLQTPAAVRFVSLEPLLGPIDLLPWLRPYPNCGNVAEDGTCASSLNLTPECNLASCPMTDIHQGISWVIVGSESGQNRRLAKLDWVRDIRDQCVAAGIPFFLKQMEVDGKLQKMPSLDGKQWDQFPSPNLTNI